MSKWTPAMDADLERRRKDGESFARIAVALKLPKNTIVARAKHIGLDPTDWSTPERFYVMRPTKHTPRRTYREKRVQNIVTHEKPEPPAPKPFRSKIQDAWPLTMCAELPLSLDRDYEPVNR